MVLTLLFFPITVVIASFLPSSANAWVLQQQPPPPVVGARRRRRRHFVTVWPLSLAKRKNRGGGGGRSDEDGDLDQWYEAVDPSKSPDDVFWEEMERQQRLNVADDDNVAADQNLAVSDVESFLNSASAGGYDGGLGYSSSSAAAAAATAAAARTGATKVGEAVAAAVAAGGGGGGGGGGNGGDAKLYATASTAPPISQTNNVVGQQQQQPQQQNQVGPQQQPSAFSLQKSAEATLSEYTEFAVADNWLDDEILLMMGEDDENLLDDEEEKSFDEQLDEWAAEEQGAGDEPWMKNDDSEPWDTWGDEKAAASEGGDDPYMMNSNSDSSGDDKTQREEMLSRQEEEFLDRLSRIQLQSRRLDRAGASSKAAAFFAREPDAREGYDRMWVSAIDNACFNNLKGTFRNYGVQFADNIGDWEDGCLEDCLEYTIEEVASFKARRVYNVTGLPCIASRTSWEIEPVLTSSAMGSSGGGGVDMVAGGMGPTGKAAQESPRVLSGYRFNDVGMHVDYICDALRPLSEPTRVTRFKTCLCYYDGEMEVYDYGVCDCDLHFANSVKTYIPVAQSIDEMIKTLQLTFGLEYQAWLKSRVKDAVQGGSGFAMGSASVELRDRVLKEGKVLPNDIIDVSTFMDSQVDVDLMDDCAKELAERLFDLRPNKILTLATTGLVLALPMAKYLQVPVVYARKERNVVMADTYQASYSSKTAGKNREILVSKQHMHEEDRVLVVDDFLSSGSSQEALLRIVSKAGATAVGVAVLLEKVYESGRRSLSGFNVPIHSLCRVASVKSGAIQLLEEEGFDQM